MRKKANDPTTDTSKSKLALIFGLVTCFIAARLIWLFLNQAGPATSVPFEILLIFLSPILGIIGAVLAFKARIDEYSRVVVISARVFSLIGAIANGLILGLFLLLVYAFG